MITTKTVDVGLTTIDKIYHLADIHIRNVKRHGEYKEVFEKFYYDLLSSDLTNSIVVLAGDLVHSKTEMSPELIQEASEFLTRISDILPLILIAGNHDCNLNNNDRLDALSPIVKNLKHKNLHYLKNGGVYKVADLSFTVMSVFDKPDKYILANQINTTKKKIALYHGPVNNAVTDIGFSVTGHISLQIFEGYDMVLLGDIHKRQVLCDRKPIVLYPGSFLQQNHGESVDNHGYCIWDIKNESYSFVDLPNDYGYFTIEVKDGKLETDITKMPHKAKLRVKCFETVPSEVKKIVSLIGKTHDLTDLTYVNSSFFNGRKDAGVLGDEKVNFEDIADVEYQNRLIKAYLEKNTPASADEIEYVLEINAAINTIIPKDDVAKNVRWKPILLEWDNLFSFGEGNKIDFTKTKNVLGLFGKNRSGKTSAIDCLTFCLFDKCSRAFKASEIMNASKMSFFCKCSFESNGITYYVERKGTKNKKGAVAVDVKFYKINAETNEEESLNGEQRRNTNDVIRDYIGTYEDFILTSLSQQKNNNSNFIDKGQTERKDLLAQFLGINIFDKLFNEAVTEYNKVSTLIEKFNKAAFAKMLIDTERAVAACELQLVESRLKRDELSSKVNSINDKLMLENQQLQVLDADVPTDINKVKAIILGHQNTVDTMSQQIETKKIVLKQLQTDYSYFENAYSEFNEADLEKSVAEYNKLIEKKNELSSQIAILKKEVTFKIEKLKKLEEHEYDPNCEYCINNVFVKDAISTKEKLNVDKITSQEFLSNLASTNEGITQYASHVESYNKMIDIRKKKDTAYLKVLEAEKNISAQEKNKVSLVSIIEDFERKVCKAEKLVDVIENNLLVEDRISVLKQEASDEQKILRTIEQEIITLSSQFMSLTEKITKLEEDTKEATELEEKQVAYEYYIEAIKRNGIPYQLISDAIPGIENEINNILAQIVEFGIILHMDGKNINSNIVYEDTTWRLELASGMEAFISSIAIRIALSNISNLPRSNFLLIDEGFGALDADTLPLMYNLFYYLKSNFDFIIIISHLEAVKDMVDGVIEIKKENKAFSSLQYV